MDNDYQFYEEEDEEFDQLFSDDDEEFCIEFDDILESILDELYPKLEEKFKGRISFSDDDGYHFFIEDIQFGYKNEYELRYSDGELLLIEQYENVDMNGKEFNEISEIIESAIENIL